jgi:hypothetical protein
MDERTIVKCGRKGLDKRSHHKYPNIDNDQSGEHVP